MRKTMVPNIRVRINTITMPNSLLLARAYARARTASLLARNTVAGAVRQCRPVRWASSAHMLPVTTNSTESARRFDEALFQYAGMRGDPAAELAAATAGDPEFLLAHATLGMLFVLSTGATSANSVSSISCVLYSCVCASNALRLLSISSSTDGTSSWLVADSTAVLASGSGFASRRRVYATVHSAGARVRTRFLVLGRRTLSRCCCDFGRGYRKWPDRFAHGPDCA